MSKRPLVKGALLAFGAALVALLALWPRGEAERAPEPSPERATIAAGATGADAHAGPTADEGRGADASITAGARTDASSTPMIAAPAAPARDGGSTGAPPREVAGPEKILARYSGRDLALVSDVARALRRPPPPELFELCDRRREGASPAELEAFVRDRFPRDIRLQALTLEVLDRQSRAAATSPPTTGPDAGAPGDGKSLFQRSRFKRVE